MSHLTRVKTQIKDLTAVRSALQEMGMTLEGAGVVTGGGRTAEVEALLRVKGGHDVGFSRQADGSYEMVGDWFYAGSQLGGQDQFVGRMQQLYGVHKAINEAALQGYGAERATDENGLIRLTLTRY